MFTGVKGFEPLNVGIKNRCLATWLYSKKPKKSSILKLSILLIIKNTNPF